MAKYNYYKGLMALIVMGLSACASTQPTETATYRYPEPQYQPQAVASYQESDPPKEDIYAPKRDQPAAYYRRLKEMKEEEQLEQFKKLSPEEQAEILRMMREQVLLERQAAPQTTDCYKMSDGSTRCTTY